NLLRGISMKRAKSANKLQTTDVAVGEPQQPLQHGHREQSRCFQHHPIPHQHHQPLSAVNRESWPPPPLPRSSNSEPASSTKDSAGSFRCFGNREASRSAQSQEEQLRLAGKDEPRENRCHSAWPVERMT
uniref:Mitogen-activated protein kinase kinase kinase kinase 4 n=1 Tax=Macrostomum lignano TaxID=282301 RepID=A0A1I8FQK6_9PLAT